LHPRFYEQLLGKRVLRDVEKGTPVSWELIG
jgi:sialic acid synthase SpsE